MHTYKQFASYYAIISKKYSPNIAMALSRRTKGVALGIRMDQLINKTIREASWTNDDKVP